MREGGIALMSNGYGEGDGRLQLAIEEALKSPLLSNNDIFNARRVLFCLYFSHEAELGMDEMSDIHNFMSRFKTRYEVKWGFGYDDSLDTKIKITILATGFGLKDVLSEQQQQYKSEEDRQEAVERDRLRKEQDEAEDRLVERYYKDYLDTRPNVEIVVFNNDELDDDNLISMMEDIPPYKRTLEDIAKVRRKVERTSTLQIDMATPSTLSQGDNKQKGVKISFR